MSDAPQDDIVQELVGPLGAKLLAKVCDPYETILAFLNGTADENLAKSIQILAKIHGLSKAAPPHKLKEQNLPGPAAGPIAPLEPQGPQKLPQNSGQKRSSLDTSPKPMSPPKLPGIGKKKVPKLPGVKPTETIASAYVTKSELRTHCPTCKETQVGKSGHLGCKCLAKVESTMMPMGLKINLAGLSKTQVQALLTSLRCHTLG